MGRDAHHRTSTLEWALGLFGLALVAASVGFTIVQALQGDRDHPDVRVEVAHVGKQGAAHLVVPCRGSSTAAAPVPRA